MVLTLERIFRKTKCFCSKNSYTPGKFSLTKTRLKKKKIPFYAVCVKRDEIQEYNIKRQKHICDYKKKKYEKNTLRKLMVYLNFSTMKS